MVPINVYYNKVIKNRVTLVSHVMGFILSEVLYRYPQKNLIQRPNIIIWELNIIKLIKYL